MAKRADQLSVWTKEYETDKGVATTDRQDPSSSVIKFFDFVESQQLEGNRTVIDLGCGTGRNSIYMANKGYKVTAVDFVTQALTNTEQLAHKNNCQKSINCINCRLGDELPFPDNYFDLAIDCVTSVSLTPNELSVFGKELQRILKPGGLFMSYVMADDDGYLAMRCDKDGYATVEETNLVDRCFSEHLLRETYKNWQFLKLEKKEKEDVFYGAIYTRRLWWLVARLWK